MKRMGDDWSVIDIYNSNEKCNITDCFFKNLSTDHNNPRAGVINFNMNSNNFANHNLSGNTFIDIKTNKSAVVHIGSFSSLIFSYNSFYNVSSEGQGGVFFFIY
jgi:hypothetical protein